VDCPIEGAGVTSTTAGYIIYTVGGSITTAATLNNSTYASGTIPIKSIIPNMSCGQTLTITVWVEVNVGYNTGPWAYGLGSISGTPYISIDYPEFYIDKEITPSAATYSSVSIGRNGLEATTPSGTSLMQFYEDTDTGKVHFRVKIGDFTLSMDENGIKGYYHDPLSLQDKGFIVDDDGFDRIP
jgi:hypothetical protein